MALLGITTLLLAAGMFLDAISIYFIFLPLPIPIALHYEWNLVWFVPGMIATLLLVSFVPEIALWLPRALCYL